MNSIIVANTGEVTNVASNPTAASTPLRPIKAQSLRQQRITFLRYKLAQLKGNTRISA
ncbi:hypothetical protein HUU62_00725 [Rhodoferax sp. 4810]|nr:hypothetical protein [Rhodoferax jenense]